MVVDGVYEYLTDFRRETGTFPSPTTWQHVWKGAVDSGGRRLTACFECSACGVSRRVSAKHLSDIIRWQQQGWASYQLLVGAMCDRVRGEHIFEVDEGAEDDGSSDRQNDLGDSGSKRRESPGYSRSEAVGGFSQEAKQFYKAQGKHLQLLYYQGESSEVDLFAWKRGMEKYFETYGIVVEREKVTMAAGTLEGDVAKWWNGLWISKRDPGVVSWEHLLELVT